MYLCALIGSTCDDNVLGRPATQNISRRVGVRNVLDVRDVCTWCLEQLILVVPNSRSSLHVVWELCRATQRRVSLANREALAKARCLAVRSYILAK